MLDPVWVEVQNLTSWKLVVLLRLAVVGTRFGRRRLRVGHYYRCVAHTVSTFLSGVPGFRCGDRSPVDRRYGDSSPTDLRCTFDVLGHLSETKKEQSSSCYWIHETHITDTKITKLRFQGSFHVLS